MHRVLILVCLFFSLLVPASVFASPVIRSGDAVTITEDQVVSGDLYAGAGTVAISGVIEGDAYIAAGAATVNAKIDADATIVSGSVRIHAAVGDDLRIIAGEAVLADHVGGDVIVTGGSLHVLSTAEITGDVIFFGGELTIEGPVGGSVFGSAESARFDAAIGGNIDIDAYHEFVLGDRTNVEGNIVYKSSKDAVRAQNAVVVGSIQKETAALKDAASIEGFVLPLLMLLFAALSFHLIFKKRLAPLVGAVTQKFGVHGLLGLAILGGVPFAIVVLAVSVFGLLVGVFLFAAYLAFVLFALVFAAIALGALIMKLLTKRSDVTLLSTAVGALALLVLSMLPFVGFFAVLAIVAMVLGGLVADMYRRIV